MECFDEFLSKLAKVFVICNFCCACLSEAFGLIWWRILNFCGTSDIENYRLKLDDDRKEYTKDLLRWKEEFSEANGSTDKEKEKYFSDDINMNV